MNILSTCIFVFFIHYIVLVPVLSIRFIASLNVCLMTFHLRTPPNFNRFVLFDVSRSV